MNFTQKNVISLPLRSFFQFSWFSKTSKWSEWDVPGATRLNRVRRRSPLIFSIDILPVSYRYRLYLKSTIMRMILYEALESPAGFFQKYAFAPAQYPLTPPHVSPVFRYTPRAYEGIPGNCFNGMAVEMVFLYRSRSTNFQSQGLEMLYIYLNFLGSLILYFNFRVLYFRRTLDPVILKLI